MSSFSFPLTMSSSSGRRWCAGAGDIDDGIIDATSQQYPLRMAALGVEWAVRNANTGAVPSPQDSEFYTEGLDFYNTGVTLITNDPQEGVDFYHG